MVEIISTERVFTNQFKSIDEVTYIRKGKQHKWIMSKGHDTVHILVYNTTKCKLLLVKQSRIPVMFNKDHYGDGTTIEACAGLIDGFTAYSGIDQARLTARAELYEELGYQVPATNLTELPRYISGTGSLGSSCYPFYCEVTDDQFVGQCLGEHEDIEVYELLPERVNWFLSNRSNTDATTRYLLQWWLLNIRE